MGMPMKFECPSCKKAIILDQPYQYHAGFSNIAFLYCDSCSSTLVFDAYDSRFRFLSGRRFPWDLDPHAMKLVEDQLKPCCCGGRYRFGAMPRCPFCNQILQDILKDSIHYVKIGRVVDGDKEDIWQRPPSKGVSTGA